MAGGAQALPEMRLSMIVALLPPGPTTLLIMLRLLPPGPTILLIVL